MEAKSNERFGRKAIINDLEDSRDPVCAAILFALVSLPPPNLAALTKIIQKVRETIISPGSASPLTKKGFYLLSTEITKYLYNKMKEMYLLELRKIAPDLAYWGEPPLMQELRNYWRGRNQTREFKRKLRSKRNKFKYEQLRGWKETYERQIGRLHKFLGKVDAIKQYNREGKDTLIKSLRILHKFLVARPADQGEAKMETPAEIFQSLEECSIALANLPSILRAHTAEYRKPSHFRRYWIRYFFITAGVVIVGQQVFINRHHLLTLGNETGNSFRLFLLDHIWTPSMKIYESIFKTFRDRPAALTSQEELLQNKQALARMLEAFGKARVDEIAASENKSNEALLQELSERASNEDMSIVMDVYTKDIRRPFIALVRGNLLEGLLIQVQRVKVDGQSAMVTLDQLLRANEITFELSTIITALVLLAGLGFVSFRAMRWLFASRSPQPLYQNLRLRMHRIQHLLVRCGTFENNADSEDLNSGRLLLEIDYMEELIESLPGKERELIRRDLKLLAAQNYSVWQKHLIVGQMYHFYPYLVRPRRLML